MEKKLAYPQITPIAPLLRRGGSVFLTFFWIQNQHKTSCEMSAGESKCSTII